MEGSSHQDLKDTIITFLPSNSSKIRSADDALAVLVHGFLISKGYQRDTTEGENQPHEKSHVPEDWNKNADTYEINYKKEQEKYLLKALKLDGKMVFYLYNQRSEEIYCTELNIEEYINDRPNIGELSSSADYHSIVKNVGQLVNKLESLSSPQKSTPKQHSTTDRKLPDIEQRNDRRAPVHNPLLVDYNAPRYDPFDYGRGDLFPGGAGGGGMLFDPMRQGRTFPGQGGWPSAGPGRIPGARFDPVGPGGPMGPFPGGPMGPGPGSPFGFIPGGPRHLGGPDPDHMPAPGFEDDMFM